jgi:hypothetical protein
MVKEFILSLTTIELSTTSVGEWMLGLETYDKVVGLLIFLCWSVIICVLGCNKISI